MTEVKLPLYLEVKQTFIRSFGTPVAKKKTTRLHEYALRRNGFRTGGWAFWSVVLRLVNVVRMEGDRLFEHRCMLNISG